MDQIKIGRFIAKCRKEKNLTQVQFAEKMGVSDRSVSKWENGRCLPDLSLFEPLCEELNITINELLSGEKIDKEHYQEKLEENIIDTIDYTRKRVYSKDKVISIMLLLFGLIIVFLSFSIFPTESSWGSIYSIVGLMISTVGVFNFFKESTIKLRVFISVLYYIVSLLALFVIDYGNVVLNSVPPRFSYCIETGDKMIVYKSLLCNVYRINRNTKNEYYVVDSKKEYNDETIPVIPFNRAKSGIDNIIRYKNSYLGDNSNDGNLINSLPLSEFGYVFEIDSKNKGLIINYHMTDWYIVESLYLQKALLYNSVSMFSLIENVEYIKYNFTDNSYIVTRQNLENNYPNYNNIVKNKQVNKENFIEYVECKMNDNKFIEENFEKIIKNSN